MSRFSDFLDIYVEKGKIISSGHTPEDDRRYANRFKGISDSPGHTAGKTSRSIEDIKRQDKTRKMVNDHLAKNKSGIDNNAINRDDYDRKIDKDYAMDAANRHIRRHPDQYKESFDFV